MHSRQEKNRNHRRLAPSWATLLATLGVAVGLVTVAGQLAVAEPTPSTDAVPISDVPLGTMADQGKPNVMLLMDTSDSMKWTHMPDDWESDDTTYFPVGYKSSLCNTLYYNPNTEYVLPKQADGVTDMPEPAFKAAWKDGYDRSQPPVDLSMHFQAYDDDTRRMPLYSDPKQPAYYFAWSNFTGKTGVPHFEDATEKQGVCSKVSTSDQFKSIRVDDGTLKAGQQSTNVWGDGAVVDGYWTRTLVTGEKQQRNFAIWYSYYRTRINMAKSSVSLAFASLNDNFRVGFLTVAEPDTAKAYSKFLEVKDFKDRDKQNWFQAIQSVKTGGTSPAREALARVGRYYGNKRDGINASLGAFVDPVVSACQRHYAIVTTDGYWNAGQETSGPVRLDGITRVGQQDGPPLDLTGAEGLIPRPIYDGSIGGYKLVHDASVRYGTEVCSLGWEITTPGGGTKTVTTYKRIVEKDVLKQTQNIGNFEWWKKSTRTVMQRSGKLGPLGIEYQWPKRIQNYGHKQGTHRYKRERYQQLITWDYINKKQYRNLSTTTWSTQTQTPLSKAVALQTRQKRYFYWYKDPAAGEGWLKTTNRSVCEAFPGGCRKTEGNDDWQVVQTCSPGQDGDFKVECDGPREVNVSSSYCNRDGEYVPNLGTIACEGSQVGAYTGPVPACGTIHPTLKTQIEAAGGNPSQVKYSNCDTSHKETSYVTEDQCKTEAPTLANGYKKTTCTQEPANGSGGETDNTCAPSAAPVLDASNKNLYTQCTQLNGKDWVAQCTPGALPDTPDRMNQRCLGTGAPVVDYVGRCTGGINGGYFEVCGPRESTWSGYVQPNSSACRNQLYTTYELTCEGKESGWLPVQACPSNVGPTGDDPPSAANGWQGTRCKNKEEVKDPESCLPAPGTEGMTPPTAGPVELNSCQWQDASSSNGCIYSYCETISAGPTDVSLDQCTPGPAKAPDWQQVTCIKASEPRAVQSCNVGAQEGVKTMTSCSEQSPDKTDMDPNTCAAHLQTLDGKGNPTEQNGWITSTCTRIDESSGGLTYLQSADAFANCKEDKYTRCVKDGPHEITVAPGEQCIPGYNETTHQVTDCSGMNEGTTETVKDKPANCTAPNCQEKTGNKKVYSGSYRTDKVTLLGTAETGSTPVGSPVPISGDLESPAVCYRGELQLEDPPDNRPQRGTLPWNALPSTHKACNKLPCEEMHPEKAKGGSSNSLADVAQYYYATDLREDWPNKVKPAGTGAEDDKATWQHMSTYVIGMGVSGTLKFDKNYKSGAGDFADLRTGKKTWPIWPPANAEGDSNFNYEQRQSIDDFWHAAVNGRGRYFSANDPKAIEAGLGEVFADIRAAMGSGAGVAVSSPVTEVDNNYAYGALYKTGKWSGDLQAFEIDTSSGKRTQIKDGDRPWSASARLDSRDLANDDRKIYFMKGNSLEKFEFDKLGDLKVHFSSDAAASRLWQYPAMPEAQQKAALGEKLVNFLRGDRSHEGFAAGDANKLYRTRESRLGDIIGSQPLYVGNPWRKYKDPGYASFRQSQKSKSYRPMVYVGGNDGMLHAFFAEADMRRTMKNDKGNTVPVSAREAWAFVPAAVMPEMPRLASTDYDSRHKYFVDGSPVVADIQVGNAWKTILVGGFNKGGKGYYALDITNPLEPKALWETSSMENMGHSFGRPLISKLPDTNGTWAVFLTSGYNNGDGKGHVFVLNANTGKRLQEDIVTQGTGLREINNFVSDPVGNNTTKLFYGGDLAGNIWRFEWNTTGNKFEAGFVTQLQNKDGQTQPITTRLELVPSPAGGKYPRILVGTGRLFSATDMLSQETQSIYGFDDKGEEIPAASLRSSLKQLVFTNITGADGKQTRKLQCSGTDCTDTNKGWYADLPDAGERVNVNMRLAGGTLVVASNVPSNEQDPCETGGHAWISYLDFGRGQAVKPQGGTGDGAGDAGEQLPDNMVGGLDLSSNAQGQATAHVNPTTAQEKPIDIPIPTATPKPLGKRISWREAVR